MKKKQTHYKKLIKYTRKTLGIVNDRRQGQYGHKINFGKHGMILDTVIESGNPTDSSRLLPIIMRLDEV